MAPVMVRALLIFAVVLPSVQAADGDVCKSPRGGIISLPTSACKPDKERCFDWMNAECERGVFCKCRSDQCIMDGQCVDKGGCSTETGGTCSVQSCDRWRNATCTKSEGSHEGHCLCGPGTCPIKGECRPPGVCAKATGGSCNVLQCDAWRKATCSVPGVPGASEHAKCMCGDGSCPINGECVAEGGCPRYVGTTCLLFSCAVGSCSKHHFCECEPGQCLVDGKCVDRTNANIELSRAWGRAQEALPERYSNAAVIVAGLLGVSAAALGGMITACKRSRAQLDQGDQYFLVG